MSVFRKHKPDKDNTDYIGDFGSLTFEEIYNKYFPELYLYLRLFTQDSDEIKDIIQDVFLKLLTRDCKADAIGNVRAWLYFCARNIILNGIRDKSNRLRLMRELFDEQPWQAEEMSQEEIQLLILYTNEAIEKLPPSCKEIFNMAKRLNMSYQQIAESKGISVKTVAAQMGIALHKIREYVKDKTSKI